MSSTCLLHEWAEPPGPGRETYGRARRLIAETIVAMEGLRAQAPESSRGSEYRELSTIHRELIEVEVKLRIAEGIGQVLNEDAGR